MSHKTKPPIATTRTHYVVEYPRVMEHIGDVAERKVLFNTLEEAEKFVETHMAKPDWPLPGGAGKHRIKLTEISETVLLEWNVTYRKPEPKVAPPKRKSVVKVSPKSGRKSSPAVTSARALMAKVL